MLWTAKHPKASFDMLGYLPEILRDDDPRPTRAQLEDRYAHGGGWQPFDGFTVGDHALHYPGDPPMPLLFEAQLHDETLRLYLRAWLEVRQKDGSSVIVRVD